MKWIDGWDEIKGRREFKTVDAEVNLVCDWTLFCCIRVTMVAVFQQLLLCSIIISSISTSVDEGMGDWNLNIQDMK